MSEPEINLAVFETYDQKPTKNKDNEVKKQRKRTIQKEKKSKRIITACKHVNDNYYSKGMCKNCYHREGRTIPARCHANKPHYSRGMCQACYMKEYSKKNPKEKSQKGTKKKRSN